jgi:H+/Cl- antiporter ClcA
LINWQRWILPLTLIAVLSALIARPVEQRSIYDARLSDEQIALRQKMRDQEPDEIGVPQQASPEKQARS